MAQLFRRRYGVGARPMAGGGQRGDLLGDRGKHLRHGQAVGRSDDFALRHPDVMAGFSAHCRKSRHRRLAGQGAGAAVQAPDAGSPARSPGAGLYHPELRGQRPGPGQRRHAHRPQGHACPARAQPQPDQREQCADPVSGTQRLVPDPVAGHHLYVPRPAGGAGPDPGVPADPAGHQRLDPGRPALGGHCAAPAPVGPGGAGLPGAWRVDPGRLHGVAGDPVGHGAGQLVVDPGQPHAVRPDHAVSGDRCATQGQGLRSVCRRGQGRLRRGKKPAAIPGGDALCGGRVAGIRSTGFWPGRHSPCS